MRVDPVESVGPNTREVAFLLVTERRIGDELAHGVMNSLTLVGMKVLVRLFERRLLTERDRHVSGNSKGSDSSSSATRVSRTNSIGRSGLSSAARPSLAQ